MMAYEFKAPKIVAALDKAAERGVKVFVLTQNGLALRDLINSPLTG